MDEQKRKDQQKIRAAIAQAEALTADDLRRKPYYLNDHTRHGQRGWYWIDREAGS